jgi:hypothetical protein
MLAFGRNKIGANFVAYLCGMRNHQLARLAIDVIGWPADRG